MNYFMHHQKQKPFKTYFMTEKKKKNKNLSKA